MNRSEKKFILLFIGIFAGVYIGLLTIVVTMPYFGWEPMKNSGYYGEVILLLVSIIIALVGANIKYSLFYPPIVETRDKNVSNNTVAVTMITQVEKYIDDNNLTAALRIGTLLSRPLWVDGRYQERIRLGDLVYIAASRLGRPNAQAIALMDDKGWTNVVLGNTKEAIKNIKDGIEIAARINDKYLMAKGKRHLGGIAVKQSKISDAKKYLAEAKEIATKIDDDKKRKEMIAGIDYGIAEMYIDIEKYSDAEKYARNAQEVFQELSDPERYVKTFSQLGTIYEKEGDNNRAYDSYAKGLQQSLTIHRIDEIIKNKLGLARMLISESKIKDAKKELKEILQLPVANCIGVSSAKKLLEKIDGR